MSYLIISLLCVRPFICEQVSLSAGFLFDFIFYFLFCGYFLFRKKANIPPACVFILAFFFAALYAGSFFSVNHYESKKALMDFSACAFMFIFTASLSNKQNRMLLFLLIGAGVVVALRAFYQHFFGLSYLLNKYPLAEIEKKSFYAVEVLKQARAVSWFSSPNALAGYLMMFCPVIAALFLEVKQKKSLLQALLLLFLFLFFFLAVLFTKTFSAVFAFVIAAVFFIFSVGRSRFFKIFPVFLICVLAVSAFFLAKRSDYFCNLKNPENSILQRLYYWKSASGIIKNNPLCGSGPGTFGIVYPRYKLERANETNYAHNLPLQLWAESGVFALGLFSFFVCYCFKQGFKKRNDYLGSGLLAGCFAFLINNFFDYNFYIPQAAFCWWIFLALLVNTGCDYAVDNKGGFNLFSRFVIVPLALVLAVDCFSLYKSERCLEKARLQIKEKKYLEASLSAKRSLSFEPENDFAYYVLALAYQSENGHKFFNEVVSGYQKAITLSPQYAFYYYYLGGFYRQEQMEPEAKKMLQKALEFYPTNKKFISEVNS